MIITVKPGVEEVITLQDEHGNVLDTIKFGVSEVPNTGTTNWYSWGIWLPTGKGHPARGSGPRSLGGFIEL